MTTVGDILQYIESLAPAYMKESWDNVGLLCGSRSQAVEKILVALDPFAHVCREAKEIGAQLLITHHPLIFRPVQFITDETGVTRSIRALIRSDISAINAHTNLDCSPGGVNDVLAQALELSEVQVLNPNGTDDSGAPWGLLRQGLVSQQPLEDFLTHVKEKLGCEGLRYVSGGKAVRNVAVGGGACAGELEKVAKAGCDTFVTADVRYNQFWEAKELGLNLIDAGHFHTENPVCGVLAAKLQTQFPQVEVHLSKTHGDCMKFFG